MLVPHLYTILGQASSIASTTRSGLVYVPSFLLLLYTPVERRNTGAYRLNGRFNSFAGIDWLRPVGRRNKLRSRFGTALSIRGKIARLAHCLSMFKLLSDPPDMRNPLYGSEI